MPPHVVVFPWPEQGHMNPAFAIAEFLLRSGIRVTLVLTQASHAANQQQAFLQELGPLLTVELVPDILPTFWLHPSATEEALDRLLSKLCPSCLVIDSFYPWSHALAARRGIPRVEIWITSALAFAVGLYVPELIARGYLPASGSETGSEKVIDFIPGVTPFPLVDIPAIFTVPDIDIDGAWFKFWVSVVQRSTDADRVLAHTLYDIEHVLVDALKEKCAIQFTPIGPLVSEARISIHTEDSTIVSWLDKQSEASVLYIAFGSISRIKDDDLVELAHGLAASEQPYLFVRREEGEGKEKQHNRKLEEALEVLKNKGRGYICSWAPQLTVLKHRSVGGFLTHCGWNSTVESLRCGVPLLCLPLGGDQPIHMKYIVNDWKAGLCLQEAENRHRHKPLQRGTVEKMVRMILTGKEGEKARKNALAWSKLAHEAYEGSSKKNLQMFVDDIKQGKLKISICS